MNQPDAIVVLSAGIKQISTGRWVSTDLTEADDRQGAPGGKLRVLAAAALATQYPQAIVIASGGKGFDVPSGTLGDRPLLSEILCEELIEAGIPRGRIELEKASNTTYGQLTEIKKLSPARGWQNVLLVTNRWHLLRLDALIEVKFADFKKNVTVKLVSSEEVLLQMDGNQWENLIQEAYTSEWLARRVEREERGIKQMKERSYIWRK